MTTLRPLEPDDWPAVAAAYEDGLKSGNATFEVRVPSWAEWDAAHFAHSRLVGLCGDAVCGWAALSPVSHREVYRGVAEVSVYVRQAWQGRGVGRLLLTGLIESSEAQGIWTLQAGIFPENVASVRLHEGCGFRLVGRRERIGQLGTRWRDTLLLERRSAHVGTA